MTSERSVPGGPTLPSATPEAEPPRPEAGPRTADAERVRLRRILGILLAARFRDDGGGRRGTA